MNKFYFRISASFLFLFVFSLAIFGQSNFAAKSAITNNYGLFQNPVLVNANKGCDAGNLNTNKFDSRISSAQQIEFCQALQEVSVKLNYNWSPQLKEEVQEIWDVFMSQNVKIRPMKEGMPSRIIAAAEAFTENTRGFNASFYLRPEKLNDKTFFLSFMHELRHVYDFYTLWDNQTYITEAELEKRGFRIMGKLHQEMPEKDSFFRFPTFWDNNWRNLSAAEIERKREEEIEKFMRGNDLYKHLLKTPEKYKVGIYQ